jgi:hypothetical protein
MSIVDGASDINDYGDYFRLKNNYVLPRFIALILGVGSSNEMFASVIFSKVREEMNQQTRI